MIGAADWPSVSVVHHIPIPTEIKTLLDSLSSRGSPIPALSASGGRGPSGQPSVPPLDRRNSGNASPSSKSNILSGKTPAMAIPAKARSGGSPQQIPASLASNTSRGSGGNVIPSSAPTSSAMEQYNIQRRQTVPEYTEKRIDSPRSSHSSPSRRHLDLEGSISRRSSGGRPSLPVATPSMSVTKLTVDAQPQTPLRRRSSVSSTNSLPSKLSPPGARPTDRPSASVTPRSNSKKASGDISSASSSSGSSDGPGSMTDGTVTSDGGFTDYLSDESEAELQRQAEAKAALVAQNQAEEQEFKAARQQLAHVDLRPPKSWNPGNTIASRLPGGVTHTPPYPQNAPYSSVPYTSSPMAHTGSQSRT